MNIEPGVRYYNDEGKLDCYTDEELQILNERKGGKRK